MKQVLVATYQDNTLMGVFRSLKDFKYSLQRYDLELIDEGFGSWVARYVTDTGYVCSMNLQLLDVINSKDHAPA